MASLPNKPPPLVNSEDQLPLLRVGALLNATGSRYLDEVEVDISTRAWKVTYADAAAKAKDVLIDGIKVPFLGLDDLIASKETYREQDAYDRVRLLALRQQQS